MKIDILESKMEAELIEESNGETHRSAETPTKDSDLESLKKSSPILEGLICGREKSSLTNSTISPIKGRESMEDSLSSLPSTLPSNKKDDVFICMECDDQFSFIENLEEHILVLHQDQRIFKCITCKAKFLDQTVLHAHLPHCSGKFLYLCFHCGEDFMYISQYEAHVETHSGENLFAENAHIGIPEYFTMCFQCGEEFIDKEEYIDHLKSHRSRKTHHCDFCLQSFCNSDEYEEHLGSCYQPMGDGTQISGTYECIDCGESFNNYTKFAEHQKLHENANFFICKCEIKFSTNLALKNHVLEMDDVENHIEIKTFHCQYCDKGFSHPGHYKRHLLSHNVKKKFSCEQCGKIFDRQNYLDIHTLQHQGDRPFVCECGKTFGAKKRLNRHKKIHYRDSLINCSQCGKGFTELSRLKCHMKTHSGLRPFTCHICNHSFTRSNHLKRHMGIH
ncbi:hypothetical protein LOTGIDRAFT_200031, partial [Lottia gigantea]